MTRRVGGFSTSPLVAIVSATGENLRQAIGSLGWLDTPVPTSMVMLWLIGLGALLGGALGSDRRDGVLVAMATVIIGVGASWALAVAQSDRFGANWQGRYYLPLLVGVPIVLGQTTRPWAGTRRLGLSVVGIAIIVLNVSLGALMRRFGVGTGGVLVPWRWDTFGAPVPLVALLLVHALASVVLFVWVWNVPQASEPNQTGLTSGLAAGDL